MSATLKGTGVVWSTGTLTFSGTIVSGTNTHLPQSVRFQRTSEKAEVKTNQGTIVSQVFHGLKRMLSITVIPSGTSVANARSSMDAYCLAPGTKISLADDSGTLIDGDYNLISVSQGRTVDGVATLDMELEAGDEGVDLTANVP